VRVREEGGELKTRALVHQEPVIQRQIADLGWEKALGGFASVHPHIELPMLVHGKDLGSLIFVGRQFAAAPSSSERVFLEDLAARAAQAIENSRLFGEAKRALRLREEVLGIVSHDLRNPLTSISIAAQMLERLKPEELGKVHKFAASIGRSVDLMDRLIGDLLQFAQIQGGGFSVEKHPEKLDAVIAPIVDMNREVAQSRGLRIELDLNPELPQVACDRRRVGQVVSNLVANAIKFTPSTGSIRVSAQATPEGAVISVADTGPGIPADALSQVFDRFWQAKESRSLGAGLGLSIAKGIVEAHGGRIWAESRPGEGSTFRFTLPRALDGASAN
jgi:signal transduction histidine kinase